MPVNRRKGENMSAQIEQKAPAIYCGTYGKYNAGSIAGRWIRPGDYTTRADFLAEAEALHNDEPDPELMFQDWEYIPAGFIDVGHVSDELWDLMRAENWGAVVAFSQIANTFSLDDLETAYLGEYESLLDYAEHVAAEIMASWPPELQNYFDTKALAYDLQQQGVCFVDGFIFQT